MKPILILLAAVLIGGCAVDPAERAASRTAYKAFALDQLALWNQAGIDPFQAEPQTLALMAALCGSATSLSTVIDPTTPDTSDTILEFCDVVIRAAVPAG